MIFYFTIFFFEFRFHKLYLFYNGIISFLTKQFDSFDSKIL